MAISWRARVPQRLVPLAALAELGDHVVELLVLGDQRVDRGLVDGVDGRRRGR